MLCVIPVMKINSSFYGEFISVQYLKLSPDPTMVVLGGMLNKYLLHIAVHLGETGYSSNRLTRIQIINSIASKVSTH